MAGLLFFTARNSTTASQKRRFSSAWIPRRKMRKWCRPTCKRNDSYTNNVIDFSYMIAQQSLETCRPFLCVCPWQKLLEKIQINFRSTESRELIIFQQPPDFLNGRIEIFRVEILRFCSFSNFLKWLIGIVVVVCVGWLLSWLHCSGWYTANRARWFPSQRPETETDVRGMTNSGKDFINVMKLGQAYICRCTQNSNRVFFPCTSWLLDYDDYLSDVCTFFAASKIVSPFSHRCSSSSWACLWLR